MAKRQAKAALAPQTVQVTGVDTGTSTITVESVSDATKKDSIEVEVFDFTIDTKGIGGSIQVGEKKTDELVVYGTLPADAVIRWYGEFDTGWENSWTFTPSADKKSCVIEGKEAGGGGKIHVEVTLPNYDGPEKWDGSSRFDVVAAPETVKS